MTKTGHWGFKEAQAFWPRIPTPAPTLVTVPIGLQRGPGLLAQDTRSMQSGETEFITRFKEAQAFWPRIPPCFVSMKRGRFLLQRGPGLLAQDTGGTALREYVLTIASKRPRPFGPGYTQRTGSNHPCAACFKEAQAFWPRILAQYQTSCPNIRSFKEAQAFWPRILQLRDEMFLPHAELQRGPGLLAQDTDRVREGWSPSVVLQRGPGLLAQDTCSRGEYW